MSRVIQLVAAIALGMCCCSDHKYLQAADETGFSPLLNGRDLTGWVLVNTPAKTWSFEDGMLKCTGRPIGEIRTDRMYQNFILEVEWRHMVPGGNAGIFVWADDITAKGVPFHRGIEVQVLENDYGQSQHYTTHGDIFPIHGAAMTPINGRGGSRAFPTEERSKPSPEWNHYRIECLDGNISLAVNGKVVTKGTACSPAKGYICIESEGGVVHYRNMKIKELPDSPIDARHVAIQNRGYFSVYSGLDLAEWKTTDAGKAHWHSRDWILHFDGKAKSADEALLTSDYPVHSTTFLFDLKPGQDFESLRVCGVELPGGQNADRLKPGNWYRIEGVVNGDRLTLSVDGRKALAELQLIPNSRLSFAPVGSADFANIFLRTPRKN